MKTCAVVVDASDPQEGQVEDVFSSLEDAIRYVRENEGNGKSYWIYYKEFPQYKEQHEKIEEA